jgi:energy-converting hydrogenase Eha subunit C
VGLLLAVLTPTGPGGYWFEFWTDPLARSIYITVAFAAFGWVIVAAGWALAVQLGARRALGSVLAAIGAVLAVFGGFIGLVGLEAALTTWNDEMALLPWGLSRILGITVYLDIPADAAWVAAIAGIVLLAIGVLLALPWRRRREAAAAT